MKSIDKINMFLTKKGMSGAEMSIKAGLSNSAYSQWNTGKTKPGKKTLVKVASVLDVRVEDIMDDDDPGLPNGYQSYIKARHELTELQNEMGQKKIPPPIGGGLSPALQELFDYLKDKPDEQVQQSIRVIKAMFGE